MRTCHDCFQQMLKTIMPKKKKKKVCSSHICQTDASHWIYNTRKINANGSPNRCLNSHEIGCNRYCRHQVRWSERIFWEVVFYKTWRQSLASPVNLARNLPVVTITQNVEKTGVVYFFSLTLLPPRDPVGVLLSQMFKTSRAFVARERA